MKTTAMVATVFALGSAQVALAQADRHHHHREHRLPAHLVEQFDLDLDGRLSQDERGLMREEMQLRAEGFKLKVLERFDADGDGALSPEEREIAHETMRAEFVDRFDSDGDGELSKEERRSAVESGEVPPHALMRKHRDRGERRGERGAGRFGPGDEMALAGPSQRGERGFGRHRGPRMSPEQMQQFDTDGDGLLSHEEKQGAKEAMRARFRERMQEFDADGDGAFSKEERDAARRALRGERQTQERERSPAGQIDGDGDGVIDQDELRAALEKVRLGDPSMDLNVDGAVDDSDTVLLIEKMTAPKAE